MCLVLLWCGFYMTRGKTVEKGALLNAQSGFQILC